MQSAAAPDRRTVLGGAALDVVARAGLDALTHQAVDDAAGMPRGSTAHVFRSRSALIDGVIEALERRDRELMAEMLAAGIPDSREALVEMFADFVGTCGQPPGSIRARARLALTLDHPELFAAAHERFVVAVAEVIGMIGGDDEPIATARRCLAQMDGEMLHILTLRREAGVDRPALVATFRHLLGIPCGDGGPR